MKFYYTALATSLLTLSFYHLPVQAAPCPFDSTKNCTLFKDILNDKSPQGLKYYAPTNYDHRKSGEVNIFDATLVQPYTDAVNAPGQIKLTANLVGGLWKSGEIMTRVNLDLPPYNSPTKSTPFTTNDISHGYIEEVIKLPKCEVSDDGLCQANANPDTYNRGMWPSIWLLPTMDTNWPQNGETDIFEAYKKELDFKTTTAALHFNGNDPRCGNGDCKFIGYHLPFAIIGESFWLNFHTYGYEWEPDPASTIGGVIMNGYFDNKKVWGPLATDSLPADGPMAYARGFHDPAGGFYLITALAMGGPYAGPVNSHLRSASIYIRSIKAYSVGGITPPPPVNPCKPPANVQSVYSADKKQVLLSWQDPIDSSPILNYQVNNAQNVILWKGASKKHHCFLDKTLPGTTGKFTYFLYTNCSTGLSDPLQYDVTIT